VPSINASKNKNELPETENYQGNHNEVKNIIFMVPDGMGLADVTAARIYKNGPDGAPLNLETLENIGYQRTYSANSIIPDSASAGSAWACGEKFINGEICYHVNGQPYNPSILELAKAEGKATGLVATSTITHATPAVFGSHVKDRNCENEIARQYIEVTGVDVMLGSGVIIFNSTKSDACGTSGNFIAEASQKGYPVVYTRTGMDSVVANGTRKLLGLFNDSGMTPEYLRAPGTTEPRLPEMTADALKILEKDRDGFFVMIEGSQVDWANHANNLNYQIGETLAFDESVQVVLDWINANPERKAHTLLIVVPDHETGGFAINGPNKLINAGESVTAGWTSLDHTGVDTMIWSQGPGSKALGRAVDNTDLYAVMAKALQQ
jgi:alkaline phosphatase